LATRIQLEALYTMNIYYFNTIEHDLNTSIYYLACALNWLLSISFTDCDCLGEIAEDGVIAYIQQEQAEWTANEEGPWKKEWLEAYNASHILSILGLVMALVSVSIVKRLELITVFPFLR